MAKKLKIIFFISAPAPTEKQFEIANDLTDMKHNVVFRNAVGIGPEDTVEPADFFCGDIPELYKARCPKVPVIDLEKRKVASAPVSPAAPVVATSGQTQQPDAERAKVDEWAKTAKVEELKQALAHFNIQFPADAKKADLLELFLARK